MAVEFITVSEEANFEVGVSGRFAPEAWRRKPTIRSPRHPPSSKYFLQESGEECNHFLDECSLCKKRIARNEDVFMYMGNMPFCSEECREEQMDLDDAKERSRRRFTMKASSYSKDQQQVPTAQVRAVVVG